MGGVFDELGVSRVPGRASLQWSLLSSEGAERPLGAAREREEMDSHPHPTPDMADLFQWFQTPTQDTEETI